MNILQYDFMVRAFEAGIAAAIVAPLVGMFLVVRRYAFLADTLSHVSLLGVATGLILGINPFLAALGTSLVAALSLDKLRSFRYLEGDTSLSLLLSSSLALAIVIISVAGGFSVDLFSFLFGSITTVTPVDVWMIVILGALVVVVVTIFYRGLFLIAFNHELAAADGVNTAFLNILLVMLAAVTVSLSMRIVGVMLIGALMVIPVVTAFQFRQSFFKTTVLAMLFSVISVICGLFIAYYLDVPSGGTIVLVSLLFFVLTAIGSRHTRRA